jgi:hypothetical protein
MRSFCETYYAWFLPSRSKSSTQVGWLHMVRHKTRSQWLIVPV